MEILTIETKALGDRSYVVVDGTAAAVIDPQRDIDRVLAELDQRLLRLAVVLETWAEGGDLPSYRSATFAELAVEHPVGGLTVLDVRRSDEWDQASKHGDLPIRKRSTVGT